MTNKGGAYNRTLKKGGHLTLQGKSQVTLSLSEKSVGSENLEGGLHLSFGYGYK